MAVAPLTISNPKLLLGEGVDEVRFFRALLAHLGLRDVQVEHFGGKTRLASFLQTITTFPVAGFSSVVSLAVTRDADLDSVGAFASISSALSRCGLAVPAASGQFNGVNPRVGVFILPDGSNPGMLEDLCLASVQADLAIPCVDAYFQCVQRQAARQPGNMAKARLHTWLASQVEPDKRLGEAAEAGFWPWTNAVYDSLRQFLRAL